MRFVLALLLWCVPVLAQGPWVYGNHTGGSAFEVCALGGPGCIDGKVEPIDVQKINAAAEARLKQLQEQTQNSQTILIIPGMTPNITPHPIRQTAVEYTRVQAAFNYLNSTGAALILTSGGNVHPDLTPFNEAWQMRLTLMREFGLPADRIVIDAYARHSTTNLRNAARFMLQYKVAKAWIVTSLPQSFYYSYPEASGFTDRCKKELGYVVGNLTADGADRTSFLPSIDNWKRAADARDP